MKKILLLSCFISVLHGMEISMPQKSSTKKNDSINVILELDEVLVHDPSGWMGKIDQSFFVQDLYDDNYMVPAYLPEFLKFLVSKFTVAFWCTSESDACKGEQRNRSIIEDIWKKVFDMNVPDSMNILSQIDLTNVYCNLDDAVQPCFGNQWWFGRFKKNIEKIGALYNTILVDTNIGRVFKGDEYNLLHVLGYGFSDLQALVDYYDGENKNGYTQEIDQRFADNDRYGLLAFYKLLYVAGVLDIAAQHETSIIDGLRAIQFEDGMPMFHERQGNLQYYKRGYRVLFNVAIAEQEKTMMHLLQAHPEIHWAVLPPEIRQLIVGYMIQLAQQKMCIFPEIEKHFYQ